MRRYRKKGGRRRKVGRRKRIGKGGVYVRVSAAAVRKAVGGRKHKAYRKKRRTRRVY